jgi:rhamnulose-1-phosphate aldolase/alcohol dehydrogenase
MSDRSLHWTASFAYDPPPETRMASVSAPSFSHVRYLWDDAHARSLDPLELLVYRSNLLGQDPRITNTGGGNTSAKLVERDPLSGAPADVLWIKGSGGDLRTASRSSFASLYLDRLERLRTTYAARSPRGAKSAAEDEMVGLYPHCTFGLNPRATSIDTPLHAFLPARHVDHLHPNALIAIAASRRAEELTAEVFGGEVGYLPWQRPGFELGLRLAELQASRPEFRGVLLGQHGLIRWGEDSKACYEQSLSLIERAARFIADRAAQRPAFGGQRAAPLAAGARDALLAALLPRLRGMLSRGRRAIATVVADAPMLEFVGSVDAPRLAALGTSCPDHFLRTKIKPLLVDWDPQDGDLAGLEDKLSQGLDQYRRDYAAYYEAHRRPDSPAMRDPNPTVILVPGVGMVAWGRDKAESRTTAEFYGCAVEVMRGAEAIDQYVALPPHEAFDIEYWALEEAKLARMPPEQPLARRVAVVVGAGHGIGKAAALRLAQEGAHVVCADVDEVAARSTADAIAARHGPGLGVAGTGVSACGRAVAAGVDVTDRTSVRGMLAQAILAYGGIDHVAVTAGVFAAPDADGRIADEQWRLTYDVNVLGSFLVADEAKAVFAAQGLHGSLVLTTSVNAVVPKRGSFAYDTSKAAQNHLVRELALELAPLVRVNGVAPATVIAGSTMFPRERVIASLEKYRIPFDEEADTETLRARLAAFYADRTLTKSAVTVEDQAEMIWLLLSDAAAKTTGQIVAVDGGLHEAFPR